LAKNHHLIGLAEKSPFSKRKYSRSAFGWPFKAVCIATSFKSKEKTGESGALIDFKKKKKKQKGCIMDRVNSTFK
jgi:hypothetical protein